MTVYTGPSGAIANGVPISAHDVRDSFDRFADSVNSVDNNNFGPIGDAERVLTYRSIHDGALTRSFDESQLGLWWAGLAP